MDNDLIKNFWKNNPCGQALVNPGGRDIGNFKDFFSRYDKFRYSTEGHILSNLDKIDFKGKRVLEVGIGQAADAGQIIDRGAYYYGIDITQEACDRALLRFTIFNKPHEDIKCADAAKIPFPDEYFDIIYSHGVLHHIPDIEKVAAELYRVLRKEGRLIMMLYAKRSLNYYVSILFLRRVLLAGLLLIDNLTSKRLIKNGILRKHIENAKREGLFRYLSKNNFLSKNTDGPDNPYSRVYSRKDVVEVFNRFYFSSFRQYFLNERQLPFFRVFPPIIKKAISKKLGWHLWCYGGKR